MEVSEIANWVITALNATGILWMGYYAFNRNRLVSRQLENLKSLEREARYYYEEKGDHLLEVHDVIEERLAGEINKYMSGHKFHCYQYTKGADRTKIDLTCKLESHADVIICNRIIRNYEEVNGISK